MQRTLPFLENGVFVGWIVAEPKTISGSKRFLENDSPSVQNVHSGAQSKKCYRESQKLAIVAVCTDCSRQYLPW